jgi:hypothetical protein
MSLCWSAGLLVGSLTIGLAHLWGGKMLGLNVRLAQEAADRDHPPFRLE